MWQWIQYTYNDFKVNFYVLSGNKNMMRKLYECKLITHDEASYILAKWFLHFDRLECSMIEDMEFFGIVNQTETDLLLVREANNLIFSFGLVKDPVILKNQIHTIKVRIAQTLRRPESIPGDIS